jgi:putrescine transport system substrate-binding protein
VGSSTRNGLTLAAAFAVAACGGGSKPPAGSPEAEEKVLNVYNWTDYVGRNTIADFEARTGIKVVYDTYDSNEIVETKMLTGASGYDIVVPTATFLERLIRTGAFLKLDKSRLPNLANMDPEIMRRLAANDPGNLYSIDYTWGMDGLAYNPQMVRKALGTDRLDSWSALFDPAIASRLASCGIAILDAPEDAFNVALIYLGRDPNSEQPEDLDAAEALWKEARPYIRYFHASQHTNDLATGEICLALDWNGLANQARARGAAATPPVQVVYVTPMEGTVSWFDTIAIPADAPHPRNAHAFINFLMDPQVIAAITRDIGYANGNRASLAFLPREIRDDPTIYPPPDVFAKLHPALAHTQDYSRRLNRAWTRIKTGQ